MWRRASCDSASNTVATSSSEGASRRDMTCIESHSGRADVGLLRIGGDEDCGEGLEVFDELVELVRLEDVVGRGGELVGERFDPFLGLPAGGGEPAVDADETAGTHPVHDRGQLGLGQVGDPAELL